LAAKSDGTYQWDSADPTVNDGLTYFDPVGTGGWVNAGKERRVCDPLRNVSFTSETHFWFEYQGGERFDFAGDDDTWVFLNGKLAIDLGGLHTPRSGYFSLGADPDGSGPEVADGRGAVWGEIENVTKTIDFELVPGGVYEVVMFQAERNECGSNFKITLKDFNRPRSSCKSTCGDGIVASNEVCDDGVNDGSYGGCMPGCLGRGPFCGDGEVQAPEQCDDGNQDNADACSNGCVNVVPK
ncbi:MAG: fibro-slime domain-containing protein, partial [Polyangiaceae bacterium]|nr:fibro-slime domain-containing protein [Polyangiaceae bacterium]